MRALEEYIQKETEKALYWISFHASRKAYEFKRDVLQILPKVPLPPGWKTRWEEFFEAHEYMYYNGEKVKIVVGNKHPKRNELFLVLFKLKGDSISMTFRVVNNKSETYLKAQGGRGGIIRINK